MSAWMKMLAIGLAAVTLASCGGGGGPNDGPAFGPPAQGSITINVVGGTTTLPSNRGGLPPETNSPYWTQLNVRVARANGAPVADGTVVNIRSDNVRAAALSILDDPETDDVNEFTTLFGTVFTETTGGLATFFVHSRDAVGTAVITASAQDPEDSTRTIVGNITFVVNEGPAPFQRIVVEPLGGTLLAPNTFGVAPFIGSPFVREVTVTFRSINGQLINSGTANVSINPVNSAAFSTLDDPATPTVCPGDGGPCTGNEFLALRGSGPVNFTAGRLTLFVHAFENPGTVTLTITTTDPITGALIVATQVFTVVEQTPNIPADITVTRPPGGLYVVGSGGRNTMNLQAIVENGSGQPIPNPGASTINNVQWEILDNGANGGETLAGVNAAGVNQDGRLIRVRSQNGISSVALRAGTRQGTIVVRVTADRADNNVDNGIQQPIFEDVTIIISDGKLFSLKIVVPNTNAIRINRVSGGVQPIGGNTTIPPDPNGTYSLTVSVLATDRQGNPVIPGTPIDFGLVDSPVAGFPNQGPGNFLISGPDGNPQEGGFLFTAPTGSFLTGGGSGPGDTLLVFGEQSLGNRDLESARRIDRILSPTSLNVTQRFNLNNDTGAPIDNGPVLPYIIGRATIANITPNALTNDIGVATTTLNYPVNQIGRLVAIWARGAGEVVGTVQELVSDVDILVFPGAGPATLVVSPDRIPANQTTTVSICIADALGAPLGGVQVGFSVANPSTTTTVDGQTGSGVVTAPTGLNGCTTATITTSGVANAGQAPVITFFGAGQSDTVTVVPPTISFLQAFPSAFFGGNGGPIRLRLFDGNGNPIPGVLITGVCTGTGGAQLILSVPPGITNANGETTATVIAINLDQPQGAGGGQCVFTAAGGSPSTTVTFEGIDICEIFFSPVCS